MMFELCPAVQSKVEILDNMGADDFLCVELPNGAADAKLTGAAQNRTFVEYLRWSFEWGGFPGWENEKNRPEKELAILRDGLLLL